MTEFKTQARSVSASSEKVFKVLSDWTKLEKIKKKIPEDRLRGFEFDTDSCRFVVDGYGVGEVVLRVSERIPFNSIKIKAEKSPVDFKAEFSIEEDNPETCFLSMRLDAELPFMLKGILSPNIQKGMDRIIDFLAEYSY